MKTSLNLDEHIFLEAQKEALQTGKTISETISLWARLGREAAQGNSRQKKRRLKPVDLGGPPAIDLTNRRDWVDQLDER